MGQISTKIAIFDSFVQSAEPLSVPNRNLSTLWTRTRMSLSFSVIFRLPTSWSGLDRGEIRVKNFIQYCPFWQIFIQKASFLIPKPQLTDIPDYILMLLNIFNNMIVEISLLRLHRVTYEGNFTGNCQKYDIFKKIAISNILNRRKNIFNRFCEQDIVPFEQFRHFSCFSFILQGDTGSPWKKFQRKLLFLTVPSNKQSLYQFQIIIYRLYGLDMSCPCLFQWFFMSLHID